MNLVPGEIVEPVGSCSVSEKCSQSGDVQILIKAIYNLSQVLVSTNITNANEMKENDFELLQAVISNLETFSSNKGKAARPLITIAGDGNPSDGCSTHAIKREMQSVRPILNSDKSVDYAAGANNTNFMKQDKLITQAFERVLDKPPSQLKESPPWLLYKNLWIEAEVALCSMKRELQAARIEIVLNNQKRQTHANSHDQLESLSDPSQMTKPVRPAMHGVPLTRDDAVKNKWGESQEPLPRNMNKGDDVDASVMARFSILKDRMEKTNPTCFEQQGAKENVSSPLSSSSSIRPNAMDIFKPRSKNEIMKEISDAPPPGVHEETEFGLKTTIASMKNADPPIVRICPPKPKMKSVNSLA
ncbi:hypothetical protein J5N97_025501 [Dioscorea zingiberensis]|uniref:Uncharacterized protein n=1 Tax=Dioscorea zingiberensis TaxID=325984 RepID=A0A9D5H9P7_9LILI|nr:hypothetical protein J5N97_025501 [Dioscorea zingiberensis]